MTNIDDLTYGQLKEIAARFSQGNCSAPQPSLHPLQGKNVIVRTVTMIFTGFMQSSTANDIVLTECSWIPDTGRYADFVANGSVGECEPYPADLPVYINKGAVLEICELRAKLPRTQK